ncbi:MAG: hypothetical protein K2X47_18875 [Bdellovibrionales bacterium]|nr:hypothetical protein [Bdellovibrionales bacterium]
MNKLDPEILTPKGRKTYDTILESAARSVASVGIQNTSITTIASISNKSRSLVAHYLPRQEDLLITIMEHIVRVGTQTVSPVEDTMTGEEKFLFSIRSNFTFFDRFPHYHSCQLQLLNAAAFREDCHKLNRSIYDAFIRRIGNYVRISVEERDLKTNERAIQEFSEEVYANLDGALIAYFYILTPVEREQYLKRYMARARKHLHFFLFSLQFPIDVSQSE